MSTQDDKKNTTNNQQTNTIKKPLPTGTITTTRSSIFELGSTNKDKKK